ncbi:MAG: DUF2807 domain-containing protein [Bacteroidia bacterium]|nr:DUF2807 domain-containing protein [Bacteroidia bacterium]
MKFSTITILTIFFSLNLSLGQNTYQVNDFSSIEVHGGLSVTLKQGNSYIIDNPDNVPLDVQSEAGTLKIGMKKNNYSYQGKKKVTVYYRGINSISVNGGANVYTATPLNGNGVNLSANGGGNLHIKLANSRAEAKANGGGNIHIEGRTDKLTLYTTGGGNIHAADLNVSAVTANAYSGGNINVKVRDAIQATAISGGNIVYSGTPSSVSVTKKTGGRVEGHKAKMAKSQSTTSTKSKIAY